MMEKATPDALRSLKLLAAATITSVAVAASAVIVQQESTKARFTPRPFFDPSLTESLNDAVKIVYTTGQGMSGTQSATLLRQPDGQWGLKERSRFPAHHDRINKVLLGLGEMEAVEPRTANPEWHRTLGLLAPEELGRARRIAVFDAQGTQILSLLVGKKAGNTDGTQKKDLFHVRADGDNQTWIARGRLPLPEGITPWLDLRLLTLSAERIRRVTNRTRTGALAIMERQTPQTPDFQVVNPPAGRMTGAAAIVNGTATAIASLTLEDVLPADQLTFDPEGLATTVETFDGLQLIAHMTGGGDRFWMTLHAQYNPDRIPAVETEDASAEGLSGAQDVRKEADALNARTQGWAFRLDPASSTKLTQTLEVLTRPQP